MLAFLKNTVAQINAETRQGNAAVARAQPGPCSAIAHRPAQVDAVTGGTQGISRYFAAQVQPPAQEPDGT